MTRRDTRGRGGYGLRPRVLRELRVEYLSPSLVHLGSFSPFRLKDHSVYLSEWGKMSTLGFLSHLTSPVGSSSRFRHLTLHLPRTRPPTSVVVGPVPVGASESRGVGVHSPINVSFPFPQGLCAGQRRGGGPKSPVPPAYRDPTVVRRTCVCPSPTPRGVPTTARGIW